MTTIASDRQKRSEKRLDLALAGIFILLSLLIRLHRLDIFVTPDEIKWVCRSVNFHRGLRTGELSQTLQTGHPGVLTMWLGVPWMGIDPLEEWLTICQNPSLSDIIESVPQETTARLAGLLFAARRGVAVLTSLAIGAAFLLLVRLFDRHMALLASALIALDPFYLAHSRLLHLDAIIASLLFLSVLSLLVALKDDSSGFLILSGILGGLAMLNKSPAIFGLPFAALVIGLCWLTRRRPFAWLIRTGVVWLICAMVAYVLCWPAMWVQAWRSLTTIVGTAFFYASNPHTNSNFFWGTPRPDPGPAFYPVALMFRLTPWSMLGALLGLPHLVRKHKMRDTLWVLAGFIMLYSLFMTVGQKKFDRYLLPVFPFMQTLAAYGLFAAGKWALTRWRVMPAEHYVALGLTFVVLVLSGLTVLPHTPYFLTYYNPLLGGSRTAVETLLVGWGEGLDVAARYLNTMPDGEHKQTASRALPGFAPFFRGRSYKEDGYDPATTDYVVIYLNDVQRRLSQELLERYYDVAPPLYVARTKGIDYAWVYENKTHEPPMSYISDHAKVGSDAIVISSPSLFAGNYQGPLPIYVLQPDWSQDEILAMLDRVAGRYERVWYVRYAQRNPNPTLEWVHFQWRTHTFLWEERPFTDVDLFLWQIVDGVPFVGADQVHRDLNLRFGDALELKGCTLNAPTAQWGRGLGLLLEWHALRDLDKYYSEFIHVVDEAGRRWGQGDRWMVSKDLLPTVSWKQGEVVFDYVAVTLNPGIPPGTYQLVAGIYDRLSHEHLHVEGEVEQHRDQGIIIGTVAVASSPRQPDLDDLPIQHRREVTLTPALRLLGWGSDTVSPGFGQPFSVTLFWQATTRPSDDYEAHLQVTDADSNVWTEGTFPLANAGYPTSRWEEGETLWRYCALRIADDAPATEASLIVTLLDSKKQPVGEPIILTSLSIEGHRFETPPIENAQRARVGDHIQLLGYDAQPRTLKPGGTLTLTLYWHAGEPADGSYTVFTHLLDPNGVVRGQKDSVPLEGRYPTDRWQPGEIVVDSYPIRVAEDAPAGEYQIEIGMYDPAANAQRVPLFDAQSLRQQDDRLLLDAKIWVQR